MIISRTSGASSRSFVSRRRRRRCDRAAAAVGRCDSGSSGRAGRRRRGGEVACRSATPPRWSSRRTRTHLSTAGVHRLPLSRPHLLAGSPQHRLPYSHDTRCNVSNVNTPDLTENRHVGRIFLFSGPEHATYCSPPLRRSRVGYPQYYLRTFSLDLRES